MKRSHIFKNCGCKPDVPCGCGDNVFTTNKCDAPSCATPEKCSEQFSSDCVLYMGDTIANLDIKKGDPMTTVVQKLASWIVNPNCASVTAPCRMVTGFGSTTIGSTSIALAWNAEDTATSYEVEYREVTSPTWLLNGTTTGTTSTVSGLAPNTEYVVRVRTNCAGPTSCYSLVLDITTKP